MYYFNRSSKSLSRQDSARLPSRRRRILPRALWKWLCRYLYTYNLDITLLSLTPRVRIGADHIIYTHYTYIYLSFKVTCCSIIYNNMYTSTAVYIYVNFCVAEIYSLRIRSPRLTYPIIWAYIIYKYI